MSIDVTMEAYGKSIVVSDLKPPLVYRNYTVYNGAVSRELDQKLYFRFSLKGCDSDLTDMVLHVYTPNASETAGRFRHQLLDLKFGLSQQQVQHVEDVKHLQSPLIVILQSASRLGSDIDTATADIPAAIEPSQMAVVVFHVTAKHAVPLTPPTSNLTDDKYRKCGLLVDFFYVPDLGIYDCELNQRAEAKLKQFIQGLTSLCSDVSQEQPASSQMCIQKQSTSPSPIRYLRESRLYKSLFDDKDDPRQVIPFLCQKFHAAGWMAGSGGALSVKYGEEIYTTPSGVQKELVQGDCLFVQTLDGKDVNSPKDLKRSTCTPLITAVYKHQPGVGAVFHLHTMSSVMVSTVTPGVEFKISHQNMIKVIKKSNSDEYFRSDGNLVVPIVENKPTEDLIEDSLVRVMNKYPESSAVLIRRHGMYVWAPTWQKAKIMAEAYDFLFDVAIRMTQMRMDPAAAHVPPEGAYT